MKIDPTGFPTDHPVSVALRRVSRHWFLAYSKLLSLQWEWDEGFPYGATDGKRLLLNRAGIDKLASLPNGTDYIAFLLVHEAMHALLGHGWRLAAYSDRMTANVAADYVVNALIEARNRELGKPVFRMIPGVLLDEKLSGDKSTEQLYRELRQPNDQQPDEQQTKCDSDNQDSDEEQDNQDSGDDPQPEASADDGDDGNTDDGDPDGDPDGACDARDSGDGGGAGGEGPSDCADEAGSDTQDVRDAEGFDPEGFPGTGAPDTCAPQPEAGEGYKETIERIEEDNDRLFTMDAIDRQTAADRGRTGQRIAAHRDISYSMPWFDLLREWLMHHSRAGWDSPFNHAIHSATGLVAAGRRSKAAGTMVWVIDTSGSVGAETFARFLGEAQVALDLLKPEAMHLLSVSHLVCEALHLEPGDLIPSSMKGGGGTRFLPAFNWVAENDVLPDVLVYLTDGLACDVGELVAPDYPVVWLSTQSPASHYPFGEVISVGAL